MKLNLVVCAIAVTSSAALAGGWIGGGGELFTDSVNPWWVNNTNRVAYCIDIDEQHFGVDLTAARQKVRMALAYWQGEFGSVDKTADAGPARLGTQEFNEVSCSDGCELRFQFGVLTGTQARFLKQPQRIIAEAVRTGYDSKTLRGRGFVYVSPETGPLALNGSGPTGGSVISGRWSVAGGKLLEMVLVHEIGHIFGLQHRASGSIMDAEFPSFVVTWPLAYGMTQSTSVPRMFPRSDVLLTGLFSTNATGRPSDTVWATLLGVRPDWPNIELRPADANHVQFFAGPESNSISNLVGSGELAPHIGGSESLSLVNLYLSPMQRVYDLSIPAGGKSVQIFLPVKARHSFWYSPANGEPKRNLLLDIENASLQLTGAGPGGVLHPAFFWASEWLIDRSRIPERDPLHASYDTSLRLDTEGLITDSPWRQLSKTLTGRSPSGR